MSSGPTLSQTRMGHMWPGSAHISEHSQWTPCVWLSQPTLSVTLQEINLANPIFQ